MSVTDNLTPVNEFCTFKDASTFARVEAQKSLTLHTVRRREGSGFEVCVKYCRVIDKFYNFAMRCGVAARFENMGVLRDLCLGFGLSPAGWQFVNNHGEPAYEAAVQPSLVAEVQFSNALCYIEWQCRAGLHAPMPQALGEVYIMSAGMLLDFDFKIDPRIARAGNQHWYELDDSEHRNAFAANEWVKVLVWIRDEQPRFDRNQWRAGWQAIWRCYQRWERLNSKQYEWLSSVDSFSTGNWYVRPLTSSYELALEGVHMKHCVASYTEQCLAGNYRLFSVAECSKNIPVATVGLEKEGSHWQVDQVQGKCNKKPESQLFIIADEIQQRCEIADREKTMPRLPLTASYESVEVPIAHKRLLNTSRYLTTELKRNFTFYDVRFLEKYSNWLEGLVSGVLEPFTVEQERFVAVAKGELPAENGFEHAWIRYQSYQQQKELVYRDAMILYYRNLEDRRIKLGKAYESSHLKNNQMAGFRLKRLTQYCEACGVRIEICRCYDL